MATPRHLYFDLEQFQKTVAKAIAFEPEESMEDFIRRFILEESPLRCSAMLRLRRTLIGIPKGA